MADTFDTVVIGTYFFDQIYLGLPQFPELGREIYGTDLVITPGATYITVAALYRLGVSTGWIGCFGTDYYSQYIYHLGKEAGIDLSLVRHLDYPYRKVTTSLPFAGERAFVTVADASPDDMVEHILATVARISFRHLHFAWLPSAEYSPVIESAHRRGATVSADCQDIPLLYEPRAAQQVIRQLDLFLPNSRELRTLTGTQTTEEGFTALNQPGLALVVKDGSQGAWTTDRGEIQRLPAIPVKQVVDTTGAGDCFNAGFLLGWLEKRPSDQSTAYGNICAGYSVQGVGGANRLLDRATLREKLSIYYPDLAEPPLTNHGSFNDQ